MPSSADKSQATLEPLMRAAFQRLLDDAADLHRKGLLKKVPLRPEQPRPKTKELRVKVTR